MADGWVNFWFDEVWVDSYEKWESTLKQTLKDLPALNATKVSTNARECIFSKQPKFGFDAECNGEKTLAEFFKSINLKFNGKPK